LAAFTVLLAVTLSSNPGSRQAERSAERIQSRTQAGDYTRPAPPSPQATGENTQAATGQRLNPPHGQPGHICEIPVGAPLPDNPGGSTAGGARTVQPAATAPQTAQRLNPPHGQPGHICEIPVGAPLPD
jgi:hypothetical protein